MLSSSLPALPTSSVAPSSGRVYSADTCNRSVPQRILFTDGGHERSTLIDGGHERSTRIGEEESTWNQQNSYHFPTETILSENKSLANKTISSDNQTELNQMNGLELDNVMQFAQLLTTPTVRTGHSRSPLRPDPVFRGMKSTGLGNSHHLSDMTDTGRQEHMYHALAPASMLKHQHRWGANNNDMLCNTGTSMKLQDANKRWVKPSHKEITERRRPVAVKNANSEKVHMSWKNYSSKKMSGEMTRPPTVLVDTPHTEDTILQFITEESQVSSIVDNVCPIQSVDSMLELLSEGMNKPLDQIPAQQDDGVTLQVTRELVHTVHSVVKRQLTANHIRGRGGARGLPGESTLFQTSDVESLLRAAKFRGEWHVQLLGHHSNNMQLQQ